MIIHSAHPCYTLSLRHHLCALSYLYFSLTLYCIITLFVSGEPCFDIRMGHCNHRYTSPNVLYWHVIHWGINVNVFNTNSELDVSENEGQQESNKFDM